MKHVITDKEREKARESLSKARETYRWTKRADAKVYQESDFYPRKTKGRVK